jgi:hypothetical protein
MRQVLVGDFVERSDSPGTANWCYGIVVSVGGAIPLHWNRITVAVVRGHGDQAYVAVEGGLERSQVRRISRSQAQQRAQAAKLTCFSDRLTLPIELPQPSSTKRQAPGQLELPLPPTPAEKARERSSCG